ncbi:MAG TPA: two-component regulator propeller domain-containing protein, partial [Candidatus Krumholzibacteria bacterium]|nr:two-component regulator propeller domain-containing protein [Candidatus Krumholzibacteria bacterium]
MTLTRMCSTLTWQKPAPRGRRKHRIRLLVAATAIVLAAVAASVPAAEQNSVTAWHVGPVPDVRAMCHAGDSLWVATNSGLFIIDIRNPSNVSHVTAGANLPSNSVRAVACTSDSVWVGTDAGVVLFRNGAASVL